MLPWDVFIDRLARLAVNECAGINSTAAAVALLATEILLIASMGVSSMVPASFGGFRPRRSSGEAVIYR
jgi:hypothetical protein